MNSGVGVFLLFLVASVAAFENLNMRLLVEPEPPERTGEFRLYVGDDGRIAAEMVSSDGESVRTGIDTSGINYGRAIVDLVLTDPLLIRSPLGEVDDGAQHFGKMATLINHAVDKSGQQELLAWVERASAEREDFFFNDMADMLIHRPGTSSQWIETHIANEDFQLEFILLRNLYWITFTRLMDMNDLCEPMEVGARMKCYLLFADLLGMTE